MTKRYLVAMFLFPVLAFATITSQTARSGPFVISGSPQVIPVGFPFQQGSDLLVMDLGPASAPYSAAVTLTLGSDYTVTGGGYNSSTQMQVGSLSVVSSGAHNVQTNDQILIQRNVPVNQISSLSTTGPLTAAVIEKALDKQATLSQQLTEADTRALHFPAGETLDGSLVKVLRSGNLLGFGADGSLQYYPVNENAFVAGTGLSTNTISALKALIVTGFTTGQQAYVSGYYTPGDGGGGIYVYISSSALADNGGSIIAPSVGAGRWFLVGSDFTAKQFGAKGDGSDDTTAITNYWTYAKAIALAPSGTSYLSVGTATMIFPAGNYVFNGPALDAPSGASVAIVGAGKEVVQISLGAGIYFFNTTSLISNMTIRGIHFDGGKGTWRHAYTGINVQGHYDIKENIFTGFTECAIGNLASDMPYFIIEDNLFYGTLAAKSIALAGQPDEVRIVGNSFLGSRYSIKLGYAGHRAIIDSNDFTRFNNGGGAPKLTDIWIVPYAGALGLQGQGLQITANAFGNENVNAADYRVLVADEAAGTDFITKNSAATLSTAGSQGVTITNNNIACGSPFNSGFVYSYTRTFIDYKIANNFWYGGFPNGQVQFDPLVTFPTDERTEYLNVIDLTEFNNGSEYVIPQATSKSGSAIVSDPLAFGQGYLDSITYFQGGFDPGFTNFAGFELDNTTASISNGGVTSINAAVDSLGGPNAVRVVFMNDTGTAFGSIPLTNATVGRRAWMEVEIKAAAVNPITKLRINVGDGASNTAIRRYVNVPSTGWQIVRIPFVLNQVGSLSFFLSAQDYSAGVREQVQFGRIRFYHASQPVNPGTVFHESVVVYDPPNLADGAGVTTTVAVIGVKPGDYAQASFELTLQGIIVTAYVSANDVVSVRFQNETGAPIDLGSTNLRVRASHTTSN